MAFPECGPLDEDSAAKLKSGQLNVCAVYILCTLFRLPSEICAGLTGTFRQKLVIVMSVANDMV